MIEKLVGIRRARQLHRLFRHFKVTLLCLLLTIIVLRGTIGAGKFGTPEQDFLELRNRFVSSRKFSFENRNSLVKELRFSNDNENLGLFSRSSFSSSRNVIVGWDDVRDEWMEKRKILKVVSKPRVLLVTGFSKKRCENSLGDYYLLKSIKNKIDYCRLHGIEVYYDMALLEAEKLGFLTKLSLIKSILLSHMEEEFVWWMDSGAIFTDMAFEVPWEKYKGYNLVMHGWEETVFEENNWAGMNTGSFLIRNCQWSLDLIESWITLGLSGKVRVDGADIVTKVLKVRTNYEAEMVYFLADEKEKWGGKVYLENEYYLQGFWEVLVGKNGKMVENYRSGFGDHSWPLVTHFVGCKPCAEVGDYSNERCLEEMERAFNFGDNQVSGVYGSTHNSSSSSRTKKVENDMLNREDVDDEQVNKPSKVSSS